MTRRRATRAQQIARLGGLTAQTLPTAPVQLAGARKAFEARFANEAERKLYYARLAFKSAQARRARKAGEL